MINLSSSVIKVRTTLLYVDLHKSFDGLSCVLCGFKMDKLNVNASTYSLTIEEAFSWPPDGRKEEVLPLAPEALRLLQDGVDPGSAQMRGWY